jgi:hypothetical protein
LNEDEDLTISEPAKKNRAILETDLDGSYVMTQMFGKFLSFKKSVGRARFVLGGC